MGIRIVGAQAHFLAVFLHKARDVAGSLQCFPQVAVIVGLIGRKVDGLAQFSNRLRQVAGLAQDQSQCFVQSRVARLQSHRFMVFADGGRMVADGKVGGGKLRVGCSVVRPQTG